MTSRKPLIRDILKRMRHIYRMYKFVKLVSDTIKGQQEKYPDVADSNMHYHPEAEKVIKRYAEVNHMHLNLAQDIAADVAEDKWVILDGLYYCANKKTRQLVEGIPFFRPGLLAEWFKEYGALISFFTGGFVLGVMLLIIRIVKHSI